MNHIQTTHHLDFLSKPDPINALTGDDWQRFKIGTCHGQWRATKSAYEILSVINDKPGNGHLNDVFEWFEHSCRRDQKALIVREIWNKGFYAHLKKCGFKRWGKEDLIKRHSKMQEAI